MAVRVFDDLGAGGVAWVRVAAAAAVLWAWRRPTVRRWPADRRRAAIAFGTVLAVMNLAFYLAIERLPLGTAVAIEFTGPIAVAALGSRSRADIAAVVLAAAGVVALADVRWEASPAGVLWALAAASMWAGYIVLGGRMGADGARHGLDGLAASSAAGALVIAPVGVVSLVGAPGLGWWAVAAAVAVGIASNVVPYALDQVILGRLTAAHFALLSTLLPVTASVVGVIVLGQRPTAVEAVGIGLVVAALAVRRR